MEDFTDKFWDTTYRNQIGKLIGICYRYTSNQQVAEDLAHDAFVLAMGKSAGYNGKGSFEAWLRKIVVNVALHYLRDRKQKHSFDKQLLDKNITWESTHDSAEENPQKKSLFSKEQLLEKINQLPEHHRLVFNLYVIDKYSHAQIGKELGISAGTSRSHLARARKKLHKLLYEEPMKQGKEKRKRALLLLILPFRLKQINKLYQHCFKNFEILPKDLDFVKTIRSKPASIPVFKPAVFSLKYLLIMGIPVAIISVVFVSQKNKLSDTDFAQNITEPIVSADQITWENKQMVNKERLTTQQIEKSNRRNSKSITENEYLKNKEYKILPDTLHQSVLNSTPPVENVQESVDSSTTKTLDTVGKLPPKHSGKSGTFFATQLIWSEKDHTIYLQGKVKIHYNGREAFLLLGRTSLANDVYLLSIDNELIEPGSWVWLRSHCTIVRLTSEDAIKRYGEKGKYGAVEITTIKKD